MRHLLPQPVIVLMLLAVLLLSGPGCESRPIKPDLPLASFSDDGDFLSAQPGRGLVASPDSPIPDMPVPVGFAAVTSKSSSSFDGQTRRVHHVYQGRAQITECLHFYRQNLWRYDWEYLGFQRLPGPTARQRFVKGRELLTITMTRHSSALASSIVTLTVDIGPAGALARPAVRHAGMPEEPQADDAPSEDDLAPPAGMPSDDAGNPGSTGSAGPTAP